MYFITQSDDEVVTLDPAPFGERGLQVLVFSIIGVVAGVVILAGLLNLLPFLKLPVTGEAEAPTINLGYSLGLLSFGCFFLILIIQSYADFRRQKLPKLTFDSNEGALFLADDEKATAIPYTDLLGFDVVHTSTGYTDQWDVFLMKKDGARWPILKFTKEKSVNKAIEQLEKVFNPDSLIDNKEPIEEVPKIEIEEREEKLGLKWKDINNPLKGVPLGITIGYLVLVGVFAPHYYTSPEQPAFTSFVLPIAILLILGLSFSDLISLFGSSHLSISKDHISTYKLIFGKSFFKKSIKADRFASLTVELHPEMSPVIFYSINQYKQQIKAVEKRELKDKVQYLNSSKVTSISDTIKLRLPNLSVIEKIQLEYLLQEKIKEKFNVELK